MNYLIPALILVPLLAGVFILVAGRRSISLMNFGVTASALSLVLSLLLILQVAGIPNDEGAIGIAPRVVFAPALMQFDLPISVNQQAIHWQLQFGADGIGALMVLLTGIVGFATILFATLQIKERIDNYIALLLIAQAMLMGVFLSMDLVSFYVFFEAVLIPLILLINSWGDKRTALRASRKFLLYTLAGSIPMVIGLIALAMQPVNLGRPSTISLVDLSRLSQGLVAESMRTDGAVANLASKPENIWIVWLLLLGFGIKLAILPLHSWLPTTYASAHPNTTAFIASVVAKLGLFGIVRIVIPLTPASLAAEAQMVFGTLGAIVIVYGALVALSQSDMRRVLAYSSLSHVGFITLGLMSLTPEGVNGATLQMFNHGLITASMFLILAALEERRGAITLAVEDRGLAASYPKLAVLLVFFTLAGAGLPGLNGFVGELLAMTGMMRVSATLVAISVLGTVLGAWYGLRIVQRLLFGSDDAGRDRHRESHDIGPIEWAPLTMIAVVCLAIGIAPQKAIDLYSNDVGRLVRIAEPASKLFHPEIDQLAKE